MSAETRSWLARYWPMLTVLAVRFAVSGWIAATVHADGRRFDEQRFELETRQVAAVYELNMARYEERLARFADHCAAFDELPTDIWHFRHGFVTDLNGNLPAVLHAVYCPRVEAADFAAHLERGRQVWGDRYRFDAAVRDGRDLALPIWQYWGRQGMAPLPPGSDAAIAGRDYPSLRPALGASTAWSDTQPSTVRLTDGTVAHGFWFGFPLFAVDQAQPRSVRDPRLSLEALTRRSRDFRTAVARGVLAVFLSTDHLVDRTFNAADRPARVHVRLYSSREPRPGTLLNPVSAAPSSPRHRQITVKPWYQQRWCLEFVSTPLFEAESSTRDAWPLGLELEAPPGTAAGLSATRCAALARIARSALGNALRHADARRITVTLRTDAAGLALVVADDGRGWGFVSMRRRAADAGGTLRVESTPGHGTRIEVRVPADPSATCPAPSGPAA